MTGRAVWRNLGHLAADAAHFVLETLWPSESRHRALELHRAEIARQALVDAESEIEVHDRPAAGAGSGYSLAGVSDPPTPPPARHLTSDLFIDAANYLDLWRGLWRDDDRITHALDCRLGMLVHDLRDRAVSFAAMGD